MPLVIASVTSRSDVAYLVGSDARPALLWACSESEVRPRDLVTDCDVSRATVHRALNGFLERGWIETTESCYSTTPFGESVLDQYDRLLDAVDRANEFGPWYQEIDASDEELPVQAVCNGSVVTATSADPTAPLEFVSTVVSTTETSCIRICTPTHARFVEVVVERIADTDGTLEIVVSEGVLAECTDRFDDIRAVPGVTIYPADEGMPCGIVILEAAVLVLGFDHANRLTSAVEANSPDLRSWAMDVFESVATRSTTAV